MIDTLKRIDTLNITLSKLDEKALEALYLRVFSSADGELVLRDLANRAFVEHPTDGNLINEGMRNLYLSIQNRLLNAVSKKEEVASD